MTSSEPRRSARLAATTDNTLEVEAMDGRADLAEIAPRDVAPEDIAPARTAGAQADPAAREERFAEGVRGLRVGGASFNLGERLLLIFGGIIAPLGILVILLAWRGAARTGYVFEQVPYLISGGLLGLALVFLGGFFYFAHWMTQLVKEHRVQSVAMLDALQRLQDQVERLADGPPPAGDIARRDGDLPEATVALVATARGTMAHRPECTVVAGKAGMRPVAESDGLTPCRLCEPY